MDAMEFSEAESNAHDLMYVHSCCVYHQSSDDNCSSEYQQVRLRLGYHMRVLLTSFAVSRSHDGR